MIQDQDIRPDKQLYYIATILLKVLSKQKGKFFDFASLFQSVNTLEKVSVTMFLLALDWLFIIKSIDFENGKLKKCF